MTLPPQERDWRRLLFTLWVFLLFNITFRDIHQVLSPGYMDMVLSGEMFGTTITDELLLWGGVAVEVMLIMILLPFVLPARALRWSNGIGAVWSIGLITFTPPLDPDDWFFLVICLATLAALLCLSIRPPKGQPAAT